MIGVLEGFAVIAVVIVTGFLLGKTGILGPNAQQVISRLVFFVATPALMFVTLQESPPGQVFNANLLVQMISAIATLLMYLALSRWWWRPAKPEWLIGGMSTSYANGGNLGIPLSVYIFHSATYVAPIMLFQIAIYGPIMAALLDVVTGTHRTGWQKVVRPVTNPMLIASVIGILLSVTGIRVPDLIMQPIQLLGNISVPGALLAFGISLGGMTQIRGTAGRHDVSVIVVMKLLIQPAIAYALAAWLFRLGGLELYACVAIAALPTAQNLLTYATRYERGRFIARTAILVTTVLSIPVLLLITVLLSPSG